MTRPITHGTQGGYQAHRRRGVPMCAACLDTSADYMQAYRESRPGLRLALRNQVAAYNRAELRLRKAHLAEFARYYDEELGR